MVIDLLGLTIDEVKDRLPEVYQRVLNRVKPERDQNNRAAYRDQWWIFGEPRKDFRPALVGLRRYIATTETSKHRTLTFMDAKVLPDNMLINIALEDASSGALSSRVHLVWVASAGRWRTGLATTKFVALTHSLFPSVTIIGKQGFASLGRDSMPTVNNASRCTRS